MSYTQDSDTGMVLNVNGEELFQTNLRGEAAMTLAKFYDMAFSRGLLYYHYVSLTSLTDEDHIQSDQNNTINWNF